MPKMSLTAAGVILVYLSAFVLVITTVVQVWSQNWKGESLPLNRLEVNLWLSLQQFREVWGYFFPTEDTNGYVSCPSKRIYVFFLSIKKN